MDAPVSAFEATSRVNYLGVVHTLKAVLPGMVERCGRLHAWRACRSGPCWGSAAQACGHLGCASRHDQVLCRHGHSRCPAGTYMHRHASKQMLNTGYTGKIRMPLCFQTCMLSAHAAWTS